MLASSTRKWIWAQIFFAWVGFVHYLRKFAFWKPCSGLEQFKANYFSEGYLPVSPELRAIAHEPMRCTTCGLCDAACPEGLSPMRMLLRGAVIPAKAGIQYFPGSRVGAQDDICSSCHQCEQACPEDIPIIQYVQLASKTFYDKI